MRYAGGSDDRELGDGVARAEDCSEVGSTTLFPATYWVKCS